LLPLCRLAQQVTILTKQDSPQSRCTVKQHVVGETTRSVLLRCKYVHSAQT
jgi:hypothetical protein